MVSIREEWAGAYRKAVIGSSERHELTVWGGAIDP